MRERPLSSSAVVNLSSSGAGMMWSMALSLHERIFRHAASRKSPGVRGSSPAMSSSSRSSSSNFELAMTIASVIALCARTNASYLCFVEWLGLCTIFPSFVLRPFSHVTPGTAVGSLPSSPANHAASHSLLYDGKPISWIPSSFLALSQSKLGKKAYVNVGPRVTLATTASYVFAPNLVTTLMSRLYIKVMSLWRTPSSGSPPSSTAQSDEFATHGLVG
mmetsp:Transcript_5931/g.20727  ORF Transcript_5931/g.20727 Transcript_5931/m.20727 type:complete len:219 (-) Transcript_5931:486-1142(-)